MLDILDMGLLILFIHVVVIFLLVFVAAVLAVLQFGLELTIHDNKGG